MRIIWACIVASSLLLQGGTREGKTQQRGVVNLKFLARPEKGIFSPGERIVFIFLVRNEGETDVLSSRRFLLDRHVSLKIIGPSGREAPGCGKVDGTPVSYEDFAILRPQTSVTARVTISCEKRKIGGYEITQPGEYKVVAKYYLTEPMEVLRQIAGSVAVAKQRLTAPSVSFRVGSGH